MGDTQPRGTYGSLAGSTGDVSKGVPEQSADGKMAYPSCVAEQTDVVEIVGEEPSCGTSVQQLPSFAHEVPTFKRLYPLLSGTLLYKTS